MSTPATTTAHAAAPLLAKLRARLRAAYLRRLIAAAEEDEARHLWHAEREPLLAAAANRRAAELRIQLIDAERTTRC